MIPHTTLNVSCIPGEISIRIERFLGFQSPLTIYESIKEFCEKYFWLSATNRHIWKNTLKDVFQKMKIQMQIAISIVNEEEYILKSKG